MTPQTRLINRGIEDAKRRQDAESYYDRKHRNYYPLMALGMVAAFWLLVIWLIGRIF